MTECDRHIEFLQNNSNGTCVLIPLCLTKVLAYLWGWLSAPRLSNSFIFGPGSCDIPLLKPAALSSGKALWQTRWWAMMGHEHCGRDIRVWKSFDSKSWILQHKNWKAPRNPVALSIDKAQKGKFSYSQLVNDKPGMKTEALGPNLRTFPLCLPVMSCHQLLSWTIFKYSL